MKSKNTIFDKNKVGSGHDLIYYNFDTILKNKHLFDEKLQQLLTKAQQTPERVSRAETYITSYFQTISKKSMIFKWVTPSGTVPGKYWNQSIQFLDLKNSQNRNNDIGDIIEDVFNNSDVKVFCNCPDFLYKGFKYMAYTGGYGLKKETRYPNIRNPNTIGSFCKHLINVSENIDDYKDDIVKHIKKNNLL